MHDLRFNVPVTETSAFTNEVILLKDSIVSIIKTVDVEARESQIESLSRDQKELLATVYRLEEEGAISVGEKGVITRNRELSGQEERGLEASSGPIPMTYEVFDILGRTFKVEHATDRSKKHIAEMWAALSDDT